MNKYGVQLQKEVKLKSREEIKTGMQARNFENGWSGGWPFARRRRDGSVKKEPVGKDLGKMLDMEIQGHCPSALRQDEQTGSPCH